MEVIFDSSQQVFHLRNQKLSYLIQLERFWLCHSSLFWPALGTLQWHSGLSTDSSRF